MASSVLREIAEKYRLFVIQNPELLSRCESTTRILAYLAPGGSAAASELISSLVSIVVMINDAILRSAANIKLNMGVPEKYLTTCLTILDHVEVFLELASIGSGGDTLKWFIVVCINIFKAVLRFLLLYKYRCGILSSPPVPSLRRDRTLIQRITDKDINANTSNTERKKTFENEQRVEPVLQTFTLKSSGRTVRSLAPAQGGGVVGGAVSHASQHELVDEPILSTTLDDRQLLGESLHIARPLIHLLGMYICGQNSWKPYLVAGSMDISSLLLLGDTAAMNRSEREEIRRRSLLLLLYLLRSPFYDNYSRKRLMLLLGFLAYKVPGIRLAIRPLMDYLPVWQRIYSYIWMT